MTPESHEQGWDSYRRMIVDWHDDDAKAHERIDTALAQIQETLIEMKTERKISGWAVGILVPAIVALVATGVAHAVGW